MKIVKIRPLISMAVLAASVACLLPAVANAQSTYRSDRDGRPILGNGNGSSRRDFQNLSGRLLARTQRARAGDTIALFYTITNDSRVTQTFRFPSSLMFDMEAIRVDVRSEDRGGNGRRRSTRWRYSDDQFGAQVLSEFTLRPGQSRSFGGKWQIDRNQSAGTYEVTSFLTPQRANRVALATTRVIIENDRGYDDHGNGGNGGGGGWNGGNNGGWNDRNEALEVTDLVRSNSSRYVDRRVTVRGVYRSNGSGNNSWLLDGDNIKALVVIGPTPRNARINDRVTVSGVLRQSRDGRLSLQAD